MSKQIKFRKQNCNRRRVSRRFSEILWDLQSRFLKTSRLPNQSKQLMRIIKTENSDFANESVLVSLSLCLRTSGPLAFFGTMALGLPLVISV